MFVLPQQGATSYTVIMDNPRTIPTVAEIRANTAFIKERISAWFSLQPHGTKRRIAAESGVAENILARVEDSKAWRPSLLTLERLEQFVPDDFVIPE